MIQRAGLENVSTAPSKTVCDWLIQNNRTWLPWIPVRKAIKRKIYIGGMFPSLTGPEAVWSSPGDELGALMAIESVNRETAVLKDYVLEMPVVPTQCRRELVLSAYISYLNRDPSCKVVGILGPACSKATLPMAAVSHFHNMIVMGYGADDVSLSDRTRYPNYFRTAPSIDEFKIAYLALFDKFHWKRCVTLRERRYPAATVVSRTEFLTNNGVYVLSREIPSEKELDAKAYVNSIKDSGLTVIILNAYPSATRAIMCEAYRQVSLEEEE
jgi:gamma-aminobutyric acid type B receptor